MTPLCSVLIPSRKRIVGLQNTLKSIVDTAFDISRFEACLRIDRDDFETIGSLKYILDSAPTLKIKVLIGDRKGGYNYLAGFYNELCTIAEGQWVFVMNDDITLEGAGWDTNLAEVPGTALARPGKYILGGASYSTPGCAYVCPIVSRELMNDWGPMANPVDVFWDQIAKANGIETVDLMKLTINHQRPNDAELEKHRNT
jgi:hypothetical protein